MAKARPYEVTLVFRPDLDEAAFTANLDKVKG
jgi:ribosomal protein S6